MQGKHISLWAYVRGEAARDLPYTLWQMVEEAGDWKKLFWVDAFQPSRVPMFGDLVHWVDFMHSVYDPKVFVLVADNETGAIAGFIWFNRLSAESVYGSIWIAPKFRGKPHVREAGVLGLRWAHELLRVPVVYTITPWPEVKNFDKRIGFKELAVVPKLCGPDVYLLEHRES